MKYLLFTFFLLGCFTIEIAAHPAWGIVIDQENNIYFADISHNGRGSIWKLDSNGKLELLLRDFHAHNVSLDADGNLITAHGEDNHTMIRLSPTGKLDTLIHTTNLDEFFGGNCTYLNGNIYFGIDKHIWIIDNTGKKRKFSSQTLEANQAVFVDESGNVYAPDKWTGNGVLYKISPNGNAELIASDLLSNLDRPRDKYNDVLLGMAKDLAANVYIAESAGQRILRISDEGETSTFYKSKGTWIPTALTFHNGETFILEVNSRGPKVGPKITKLDPEGNATELFNYDTYQSPKIPKNSDKKRSGGPNVWWYFFLAGLTGAILLLRSFLNKSRT